MFSCLYCAIWFFIQMAELLVLVFYVRGYSDNVRAFHTFFQKVRN